MVVRLAEQQRRSGHDASILAIWGGPVAGEAGQRGIPVYLVDRGGRLARVARTSALVARLAPEVIHAHNPTALHFATLARMVGEALSRLAGDVTRCGLVMTDHQSRAGRVPSAFEWRRTDAVVAVSGHTAEGSSAKHRVRVLRVIHNGVDIGARGRSRAAVRAELGLGDEPVCITVANIRPEKDYPTLVRACARLRDEGVRLGVLAVGEGPDRPAVEALARSYGLGPDRLRFLGARNDVPDLLRAADIFVLSSALEGLPLALLEAMAAGLPVVATAAGGVPEVVQHGVHGFIVPTGSPGELAAAMEALASDRDLLLEAGARAFAHARDRCSLAAMASKYEALYDEVCSAAT